jgi:hypothetical protein
MGLLICIYEKGKRGLAVQQSKVTRRLSDFCTIDFWGDRSNDTMNVERVDWLGSTQIRKGIKPDESSRTGKEKERVWATGK